MDEGGRATKTRFKSAGKDSGPRSQVEDLKELAAKNKKLKARMDKVFRFHGLQSSTLQFKNYVFEGQIQKQAEKLSIFKNVIFQNRYIRVDFNCSIVAIQKKKDDHQAQMLFFRDILSCSCFNQQWLKGAKEIT